MSLLTYLDPNAIKDASIEGIKIKNGAISSSKIDETVASKSYVDALEARATNAVSITYSELKSLRDAGKLVAGTQYRITDYTCTTIQENTKSAGHQFDIIVTADDEGTLNEEARAALHTGDEYFSGCTLSAWQIWYCLDNDTNRFGWADGERLIDTITSSPGPSTVTSRTYTYSSPISKIVFNRVAYNLEIGVRTQIYSGHPVYITVYVTKTDDYTLVVEDTHNLAGNGGYSGISVYTDSKEGKGVIYRMIDEFNNDIPYDFKNIQFKHPNDTTTYPYYYYTFAEGNKEDSTDNSLNGRCYSNIIKEYVYDDKRRELNHIIFTGAYCYNNSFGFCCRRNSFKTFCDNNSFGNLCENNSFGNYFRYNSFGNNCYSNIFGDNCEGNTFGNDCYSIKFASDSSASTKYNYYQNNYFGDGCQYIVFTGAATASSVQQVQNYNFAQGLRGTSSAYLTIDGVRGRSFETKVAKKSNGEVKIYCEADLIL